jgi:hypothetical protein
MAYSDFTLDDIKKKFQLAINERHDLFSHVSSVEPGDSLTSILRDYIPLALAINTEKARSELMIAPLLVELRRLADNEMSLFSGVEFNVDATQGLNGVCDFIVSNDVEQLYITAPVIMVVEAKNENMKAGLPQCMAAMIAARLFNVRQEQPIEPLYGVVTTGNNWRFLRLEQSTVSLDRAEYYIANPGKILGILSSMVPQRTNAAQR